MSVSSRYWLKRGPIWNAGRQNLGKPTKFIGLVNNAECRWKCLLKSGAYLCCSRIDGVDFSHVNSETSNCWGFEAPSNGFCVTTKFHDGRTYRPRVFQRLIFLAINFLIHIFLYSGKSPDSIVARINFIALNEFVLVTLNYCSRIWVDLGSTSVTSYSASSMWSWMNCFPIGTHVFPMLHVIKSCHPVFFFASAYCGCFLVLLLGVLGFDTSRFGIVFPVWYHAARLLQSIHSPSAKEAAERKSKKHHPINGFMATTADVFCIFFVLLVDLVVQWFSMFHCFDPISSCHLSLG